MPANYRNKKAHHSAAPFNPYRNFPTQAEDCWMVFLNPRGCNWLIMTPLSDPRRALFLCENMQIVARGVRADTDFTVKDSTRFTLAL